MRKQFSSLMGLCALLLLTAFTASAQTKAIKGKITDVKDGAPISGATIHAKNSSASAISAADGSFSILVDAKTKQLQVLYVGYATQTITIGAQETINVALEPSGESLSEIVVVGYGTKAKRDVTGSVAKVASKDIANTPATSFESALQGRAAGVQVSQQNGKLGQGINIRIRGASSVTAGNEPLYVVDGIPITTDDMSSTSASTNALADINMNDIESIEILKDASAAAIYGSRGSNGVVIITTKKGKAGTSKVELGYFSGFQKPTHRREFMNATQYVEYFKQAGIGAAKQDYAAGYYNTLQDALDDYDSYVASRMTRYSAGTDDWETGKINTNWQDQVLRTAPMSQYDFSVTGGTDKTKIYFSGQYLDQKGILIANSYKRYGARLNIEHKVKDWLTTGINMSFARSLNYRVSNDNAFSTPLQIIALSPITPVIDPRTGLTSGALDLDADAPNTNYPVYYNPLLDVENAYYHTLVNRTIGNAFLNVNVLSGLTFRTELGMDQLNQTEDSYYGRLTARNTGAANGSGTYSTTQMININTNSYFAYNKTFNGVHAIDATFGMSYQNRNQVYSTASGEQFPGDAYKTLSGAASKTDASGGSTSNTLLSYFLRANYKFNNKYLLGVSGRIDGSSRFGTNNRYGFFPAVSAGWIMSDETFLKGANWINFLKLKASYGVTGNDNISDFASKGLYTGDAAYGGQPGQTTYQLANPSLKWETSTGADLGIEGSILKNRIGFEIEVYQRKTKDLILSVEVPGTSGFSSQYKNVGNLNNKGIEITLNTTNVITRDFKWTSTINFSANKNKVTNLGGQELGTSNVNRAREGQPLGVFVAKEFAGADPANGDALYVLNTVKSDGTRDKTLTNSYNAATEVVIGNPNPNFIYGFGNNFSYKGFDLDVLLQGVHGNKIYNGGGQYMSASGSNGFDNQTVDQLAAWKKEGDVTMVPEARLFYANGTDPSSRYISSGAYLRVKAVTLGFNVPKAALNKIGIERIRVYARAQNLFTITKYKGWDPEVNSDYQATNINQGVDFYSAPQAKTIVFGINIGL
ncbi:TonB-linked outer membrane protein, SusC/RagA family [Filimonas lacunae]|uniref:TonB-linked outer membrane protein, SusC/RagA family n=1 Tax=Filimonas lacunae TaxID=477680 RepID=A0A1N7K689_9BACT|nr:TonB-dependent receptor [Filimonas lacunae]SIS57057.1 TonB-linked outer membrane protein, SusC/RagA family [Filimonas lacunae]